MELVETMPQILSGTDLAKKHEETLRTNLAALRVLNSPSRGPKVVSFCNIDDPGSVAYTGMKKKKAESLGIEFIEENCTASDSQNEIADKIRKLNEEEDVDGIMIQLPLREGLDNQLIGLINPEKDVDGLKEESPFTPATIKGVLSMLDELVEGWESKNIAVVGSAGAVGRVLVSKLKERGVEVTEVDKEIGDINSDLKKAKIVISATGKAGLIKPEMISEGVVLIDVGLGGSNAEVGDFDPSCYEKSSMYSGKKGGVGPMTVISLMENVVESYKRRL